MKLTLSLEFGTPKEFQRGVRPQKISDHCQVKTVDQDQALKCHINQV